MSTPLTVPEKPAEAAALELNVRVPERLPYRRVYAVMLSPRSRLPDHENGRQRNQQDH
jgi:hypothetical protein